MGGLIPRLHHRAPGVPRPYRYSRGLDRFSKGIYLEMLPTRHTAYTVVVLFMDLVEKLHGMPRSLVFDRDPLFLSRFGQELFHLSGTKLRLSSAYHPQSDGQTEILNRVIEQYLRTFVHKKPSSWGKLLRWVEWSYNTSWNSSSGLSPYEITFGKKTVNFPRYLEGDSTIATVEDMLTDRQAIFEEIKKKLEKAQSRMKHFADARRRDVHFNVGDMVLVKLRPHRQKSVTGQPSGFSKHDKTFYGPFRVIEHIGPTTYRLKLPEDAHIHPIHHSSLLKPFRSPEPDNDQYCSTLPARYENDHLVITPLAILNTLNSADSKLEVLVQWQGLSPDDTTWENWDQLREAYHLEDQVLPEGVKDDSKAAAAREIRPRRKNRAPTSLKDFV